MSSDDDGEEDDDFNLAVLKRSRPKWRPIAAALNGRHPHITEQDVWKALEKFGGVLAKASAHLQALSDERSMTPEERAIRDTLVVKRRQLTLAQRDFERAVAAGENGKADHLDSIIDKMERYIERLEGPRAVAVLLVDDDSSRRTEMSDMLDWLSYSVRASCLVPRA